jgi:thiol-disulfide isomerase/thioredoxin
MMFKIKLSNLMAMKLIKLYIILSGLVCVGLSCSSQENGTRPREIKVVKIDELKKIIADKKTPLVINFWATWCKPCIEELPYFLKEYEANKDAGLELLLVSLDFENDYAERLKKFAEQKKISAPIFWLNETNADIFCPAIDSAWSGAIPASLFINSQTGYRKFYESQLSPAELRKEIMAILK